MIALNEFLFEELGYSGNTEDYYDPRNSYLNEVIDRRTGIPITLSVLYMELGRRIGLPLEGVSFPGHFLVRLQAARRHAGARPVRRRRAAVRDRAARAPAAGDSGGRGGGVPVAELPLDQFLEPATKRQILAGCCAT